jgi:hypothetical protein
MAEEHKYSPINSQSGRVEIDKFGLEVAVKYICWIIEKKENPNQDFHKEYITRIQDYFESAIKSLDTIVNTEKYNSFHFTPYLVGLMETAITKKEGFSKKDALNVKIEFKTLHDNLGKLKKDPLAFYETKDSGEMLKFFREFLPKFQTKYPPIFSIDH